MPEQFTQFDYLLNAMLEAGRHDTPADHGYGDKRLALYEHVRALERDAKRYRFMRTSVDDDRVMEALERINRDPKSAADFDATVDAAMSELAALRKS